MEKHYKPSKNFIVKYAIILLFSIIFVSAEEFILLTSEKVEYKGITIELISIGSEGSASLKINDFSTSISHLKGKTIFDINITLIETTEDTAKISIIPNVECIIDEDCNDNLSCTQDTCTIYKDCIFKNVNGCQKQDECVPPSTLSEIEGELYYCSEDFEWEKRKSFNTFCTNNYECLSNICKEKLCTKEKIEKEEGKMAPAWILIIIGLILLIKGGFMLYHPERSKNLLRELSYIRHVNLRIFGAILAIVGILLIVWALT